MILRLRERIRGRTGGRWGWDSVLKKKIYAEFTENADREEREERAGRRGASPTPTRVEKKHRNGRPRKAGPTTAGVSAEPKWIEVGRGR
jgi:hypothetical protein